MSSKLAHTLSMVDKGSTPTTEPDHSGARRLGHIMATPLSVDVVVPALNEERALGKVLQQIPREFVRRIVVADNGSADRTAQVAREHGAEVVYEGERGYGAACLAALAILRADPPDVVVFLDGDHSDHPEELPKLLGPIEEGRAQLVIGARTGAGRQAGAMTVQQRIGGALACQALRRLYGVHYTDLGPFRAIRWDALERLGMCDRNYGWTVEMPIKAARLRIESCEVPVSHRARIGRSKVSGTVRGALSASAKILWLLGKHALPPRAR